MQQMNHESSNYDLKWLQILDDGGVEETQITSFWVKLKGWI